MTVKEQLNTVKNNVPRVYEAGQRSIQEEVNGQIEEMKADVERIESIAKGANQSVSYGDYSTVIATFNGLAKDTFNVGQNLMIITLNVPDLWISGIEETAVAFEYTTDEDIVNTLKESGYIQVGYYKLSALETGKVDLTEYLKITNKPRNVYGTDSNGKQVVIPCTNNMQGSAVVQRNPDGSVQVPKSTGQVHAVNNERMKDYVGNLPDNLTLTDDTTAEDGTVTEGTKTKWQKWLGLGDINTALEEILGVWYGNIS